MQVVKAMRLGPQQKPVYDTGTLDDAQATDIAGYVQEIEPPEDRGGWARRGEGASPIVTGREP
ncbi:MAG: hypothetical protein ACR2JF_00055 [Iamia sp.]